MRPAAAWPDLARTEWESTREAIELWSQIVGKVRLALEPMVNHWWQVPLYVSARGLTTSLMHAGDFGLEIEFDFLGEQLALRRSDGQGRSLPLTTTSVAAFYRSTMAALRELDSEVKIMARPVERLTATPFAEDDRILAYEADAARRFWAALVEVHRVMSCYRGGFIGKASPVHYFWGAGDLATTRFS